MTPKRTLSLIAGSDCVHFARRPSRKVLGLPDKACSQGHMKRRKLKTEQRAHFEALLDNVSSRGQSIASLHATRSLDGDCSSASAPPHMSTR